MFASSVALLALLTAQSAHAFYLPGAAPKDYKKGDKVELYVNALTPMLASNENSKLVCTHPAIIVYATALTCPR